VARREQPAGLAKIAGLTELTELNLDATKAGDAGHVHHRGAKRLSHLDLDGAGVTDGLTDLEDLRELTTLLLRETKVTAAGVKKLSAVLPGARSSTTAG
jgi:hypothetical protein